MARTILVIGKSGSGKTASLRNFTNNEYGLFNPLGKDLPFKNTKKFVETFSYIKTKETLLAYANAGVKTIVLDDAGYLLTNELMSMGSVKDQFKHFRDMATDFYELTRFAKKELPEDINIYFFHARGYERIWRN